LGSNYFLTIVKLVLLLTPPYDAPILTVTFLFVGAVLMLKLAELAPAGTVTFAGTDALAGLLLVSAITTAVAVTLLSVTVPTELEPPITVFGFRVSEVSAAGDAADTVNVADLITPP
jgi:hypothetical protein